MGRVERYILISNKVLTDSGKNVTVYGIRYNGKCGNCQIDSISTEFKLVNFIVTNLNQYDVSPYFVKDIVEDIISEPN